MSAFCFLTETVCKEADLVAKNKVCLVRWLNLPTADSRLFCDQVDSPILLFTGLQVGGICNRNGERKRETSVRCGYGNG